LLSAVIGSRPSARNTVSVNLSTERGGFCLRRAHQRGGSENPYFTHSLSRRTWACASEMNSPRSLTVCTRRDMTSNGEVEGPCRSARLEPRVHNLVPRPRRHCRASRTPPTIVRRTSRVASDYHHSASLLPNAASVDTPRRTRGSTNLSKKPLSEPLRRALSPRKQLSAISKPPMTSSTRLR